MTRESDRLLGDLVVLLDHFDHTVQVKGGARAAGGLPSELHAASVRRPASLSGLLWHVYRMNLKDL